MNRVIAPLLWSLALGCAAQSAVGQEAPPPPILPSPESPDGEVPYDEDVPPQPVDLSLKPIGDVGATLRPPPGETPPSSASPERPLRHRMGEGRPWALATYEWQASALSHRPLYFEEPNLERRGFSYGLAQPAVSAAHFFARIPMLPYMLTVDPPNHNIYEFGQPWPGTPGPYRSYWIPLQDPAGLVQIGTTVGLIYLIP